MSETAWVIERQGVYGQGVVAVLRSRAAAERFTRSVRPDRDGRHAWRCTEVVLDFEPPAIPKDEPGTWGNELTAAEDDDSQYDTWEPVGGSETNAN